MQLVELVNAVVPFCVPIMALICRTNIKGLRHIDIAIPLEILSAPPPINRDVVRGYLYIPAIFRGKIERRVQVHRTTIGIRLQRKAPHVFIAGVRRGIYFFDRVRF